MIVHNICNFAKSKISIIYRIKIDENKNIYLACIQAGYISKKK